MQGLPGVGVPDDDEVVATGGGEVASWVGGGKRSEKWGEVGRRQWSAECQCKVDITKSQGSKRSR